MSLLLARADVRHLPLATGSVNCCVTSPPYWRHRRYSAPGDATAARELGQEDLHDCGWWGSGQPAQVDDFGATSWPCRACYVCHLVVALREVRRVLRPDGVLWLNLGDTYASGGAGGGGTWATERDSDKHMRRRAWLSAHDGAGNKPRGFRHAPQGLKHKDLVGIPWRVGRALQADGWYLRQEVVWAKLNPQPESVRDRPVRAHETILMLTASASYAYSANAVREEAVGKPQRRLAPAPESRGTDQRPFAPQHLAYEVREVPGRDTVDGRRHLRSVWHHAVARYAGAHFASWPPGLLRPAILSSCPPGGIVLDPFAGSGATGVAALHLGRRAVLCDLSAAFLRDCAAPRLDGTQLGLATDSGWADLVAPRLTAPSDRPDTCFRPNHPTKASR